MTVMIHSQIHFGWTIRHLGYPSLGSLAMVASEGGVSQNLVWALGRDDGTVRQNCSGLQMAPGQKRSGGQLAPLDQGD